jgi:predicted amidohydrolase YtcJ
MDRTVTRRQFLGGVVLVAAGAALDACVSTAASFAPGSTADPGADPTADPTPDLTAAMVLRNATVLTMDPSHPTADAVAISGDTITAVGTEADVLAAVAPNARIVDVGGRIVLPGFNDAHCHRIGDRDISGYESAEAAIEDALAGGWTSISELFVNQERLDELRALDDANRLRLRVNCYLPVNYLDDKFGVWFGDYRPHQVFSQNLRIGGVKIFADNASTKRMFMTDPHTDRPDYRGSVYWTPEELTDLVRSLHDDGWQLATHTAGDAAHDLVLDAYEAALAGADNADHRHRIEHVVAVRDDQVRRMADLSILASFQLTWFTSDAAPDVETTIGRERLAWVGRWRDLLEAGVPAVASTDHPYFDFEGSDNTAGWAMKALSVAVTRQVGAGDTPQPWRANQAVSVEQGLELMTHAGAYATFEEDHKGTVTAGKLADLVVLSDDPRSVTTDDLAGVDVLMTMVGGRIEYCAPDASTFCPTGP